MTIEQTPDPTDPATPPEEAVTPPEPGEGDEVADEELPSDLEDAEAPKEDAT
jgi:hypothetical protein